jgi:hypothetical protein
MGRLKKAEGDGEGGDPGGDRRDQGGARGAQGADPGAGPDRRADARVRRDCCSSVPLPAGRGRAGGRVGGRQRRAQPVGAGGLGLRCELRAEPRVPPADPHRAVRPLGLVDFPRGVKLAGTRSYVLTGMGMRLHQAVLRYAIDFMADTNGFTPMSVPVVVKEEAMEGTGFFPHGRDQAYHIEETTRGGGARPVPDGDGRGRADGPAPGRDPRRGEPPDPVRHGLDVLPARGGRRGQGHRGALPHPPVRQGRAGRDLPGTTRRRAGSGTAG